MTYSSIASLLFGQKPYWLYEFVSGAVTTRFTSYPQSLTRLTFLWTAEAIEHSDIRQTANRDKDNVNIKFALSNTFARQFLEPPGVGITTVTIYKGFINDLDNELAIKFRGRVLGASIDDRTIELQCVPGSVILRRKALPAVVQKSCRHAHYGPGCGLDYNTFKVAGNITAMSANNRTLTVSEAALQANGYYRAGLLEWVDPSAVTRLEMIEKHVGNQITIMSEILGLREAFDASSPQSINIAPGCSLNVQVCSNTFSNILNYGGLPYLRTNPFDGRSIV